MKTTNAITGVRMDGLWGYAGLERGCAIYARWDLETKQIWFEVEDEEANDGGGYCCNSMRFDSFADAVDYYRECEKYAKGET